MQMPSSQAPSARACRSAGSSEPRMRSRGGRNAPTPGRINRRDAATTSGSSVMRAGAPDFVVKPASPERILVSIRNALEMSNLKTEVGRMKKKAAGQLSFDDMVANAGVMGPVVRMGRRAAASNIPVLITGESGVGKEVLARCIQGASDRAGRPFVTVNCGAIPENLVESILFGELPCVARNVSAGGIFLETREPLPLGAKVRVCFLAPMPSGEIVALGEVKNHYFINFMRDGETCSVAGMAVRFLSFEADGEQHLRACLDRFRVLH